MNCLSTNKWIIMSIAEQSSNHMRMLKLLLDKVQTDDELPDDMKAKVEPLLHSLDDDAHAENDTCSTLLDIINELDKLSPPVGITSFDFSTTRRKKPATEEVIEPEFGFDA